MAAMEIAAAVAELVAKHCTDVVMSPGSRNSPLAYALLARRDVTVHMRIDERSAAFTALGLARVQRRHVGVVMTSGTAVANAYPAVIEAHMSHTPLAVISADRPERLVGTGASQTIWQQGIFGRYAETQQVQSLDDVHAASFATSTWPWTPRSCRKRCRSRWGSRAGLGRVRSRGLAGTWTTAPLMST